LKKKKDPASFIKGCYKIAKNKSGEKHQGESVEREEWKSRHGFILAAIGSAIGLGNIWRFPYIAYENGGGAFLIPYFFALFTAGIPILILEFSLGHKMKGSAPLTFARINKKWEWLGWWQVMISFVISVYYIVIIAWALNYLIYSFTLKWGDKTIDFFVDDFLGLTSSPFAFDGFRIKILLSILAIWIITYLVLTRGIKRGIELANKALMPFLFLIIITLLIRSVTLPGAADGLNMLFKPDFSKIWDHKVWLNAYGQIFFSLSVAFAIMITYSSYLPKKADIVNNAFITALINSGFSLLSGITVFSIIGFMMYQSGGETPAKLSGIFLAFATFPEAINQLPNFKTLIGSLLFLSLLVAGLSSEVSICEAVISSIMDKLHRSRKIIVAWYCSIGCLSSLVFATDGGLYILDIVDHFINNFGIAFAGLVEVILLGWFYKLPVLHEHMNAISDFKVGKWWEICIKYITPIVLGIMFAQNLASEITTPYGDGNYSTAALITLGWMAAVGVIIFGYIFSKIKWAAKI